MEISFVFISGIARNMNNNKFEKIEELLAEKLTGNKPSFTNFSKTNYTMIGIINGKYVYEVFEEDFINKFHSGLFYQVLSGYLFLTQD